jgi:RND family efflux transporter MFP subunit
VVQVSLPVERDVVDYEYATGRTDAVEYVEIRARVSGYLEKIDFKDGAEVKANQLLFVIDPRPYQATLDQAKAQVAQADAKHKLAIADVRRAEPLVPTKAVTAQEFDRLVAMREVAKADLDAAKAQVTEAQLNLDFTQVRAPIAGRASRRDITVGNLVTADVTQLTTIVSQDPVYAYFDVPEPTMLRLQALIREGKIPSARRTDDVKIELGLASEPGRYPHQGTIDFVDNRVDPSTGTLQVRGSFPNPPVGPTGERVLSAGLFVRVRMPIGQPHKALMVAERALGMSQGDHYVLVVDDQNQVEQRSVQVGVLAQGMREVLSGLAPTERIIVTGLQRVRPGVKVDPKLVEMPIPAPAASVAAATP